MVIGATNPSAERRERAAIRAVLLEKIRPPIDVDAMFAGEGLVAVFNVAALPLLLCLMLHVES